MYNHKKKANRSGKIPMQLLKQLSIKTKLIAMLLVVSLCSMLASTFICSRAGKQLLLFGKSVLLSNKDDRGSDVLGA
jgi:hypothetical protein